jgi:tetratricopeptide (TPR) repeat protein
MMSVSAIKLSLNKSVIALGLALALVGLREVNAAYGQNSSATAQVAEMIARVRVAPANAATAPDALALAERLLIERRYAEASELFQAMLDKWPREPLALYGAALAAFNLGRAAEAEPCARAAADIYLAAVVNRTAARSASDSQRLRGADALVLLAIIQAARGDDTGALKSVQRAVALAPEHFDAQFTLGRALYGVGDSVAAANAFRAALKLRPDDARTLFFLATALESAGDSDGALAAYRELVRRQPQAAEGHLGLGVLLIKGGGAEVEKGIEELRTAVHIDPNQYEAQVTLGRALLTQKHAEESVEHLRRAAELAPANPEPHYQLALAYWRLGLNVKAVEETAIVKRIHETRRGEGSQNNTARPDQ